MTQTATIGSSKVVHLATTDAYGHLDINCGAVRYRNITTRTITRQPAGTEVTCSKCLKAAPAAPAAPAAEIVDPTAYLPGETPMQRKRRLGLIAN